MVERGCLHRCLDRLVVALVLAWTWVEVLLALQLLSHVTTLHGLSKSVRLVRVVPWTRLVSLKLLYPKLLSLSLADGNLLSRLLGNSFSIFVLTWTWVAIDLSLLLLSHVTTLHGFPESICLVAVVAWAWNFGLRTLDPVVLSLSLTNSYRASYFRPNLGSISIVLTRAGIHVVPLLDPGTHRWCVMNLAKCRLLFRIVARAWHICSYPLLNCPQF